MSVEKVAFEKKPVTSLSDCDVRSWHIAARTCATARPQLAKADTAFQGASVGQPTEPCLVLLTLEKGPHLETLRKQAAEFFVD